MLPRLPLLSFVFLTTVSSAAPAKKVKIDPAARVVLQRAAMLYSKTPKWSGQMTSIVPLDGGLTYGTISFMRPDRLRYDTRSGSVVSRDIYDGKTHYSYMKEAGKAAVIRKDVQSISLAKILAMQGAMEKFLSSFLHGQIGLEENLQNDPEVTSYTVTMRPTTKWKGQSCRRIYLATHFKVDEDTATTASADELWFNPKGLLVRAVSWEYSGEGSPDSWSSELTTQDFAPKFGVKAFELVPPQGK